MSKNVPNIVVIDFETGGLKPTESAITQVCAYLVDSITMEVLEVVKEHIRPFYNKNLEYSEKALEKTGITIEKLQKEGVDIKDAANKLLSLFQRATLDKTRYCGFILAGHNICFDIGFLQALFEETGLMKDFLKLAKWDKDYYGHPIPYFMDTMMFAKLTWPTSEGYSLTEVCKKAGIETFDMHDAGNDVHHTTEYIKNNVSSLRQEKENEQIAGQKPKRTFQFA